MILTINNKDYDLYFGFDFIDYVNNASGLAFQGVQLGIAGTKLLMTGIGDKSPSAFRTMVKAATNTLKSKPSNDELENYIIELIEGEKYDEVFDDFLMELGKHSLILKEMGITRKQWNEALEVDRKERAKAETMTETETN